MRHRRLGRSALQVSELCLGTMNFGPVTDESDSFAIMDRALELGIDFFDTANQYGGDLGVGVTEGIIGRWLAQGGGRRDQITLATKVHEPMSDRPNDRGLSARHIRDACDASLRRLGVDHIDLYQMHHIDRAAPWDEVWQAMETLVAQGKVTYVGSSNFAGWHIAAANEAAGSRHFLGIVSEQSLYNLTERAVELEVVPACVHYGVGILPWSPLAGGVLAGSTDSPGTRRGSAESQAKRAELGSALAAYGDLCGELGEAPSAVALAWLLQRPGVTAPIIGPRTVAQLDETVTRVAGLELGADALARLDEIFPGPGGPAPEAYAW